ncbi:MAG: hypothetical protein JOZ55_07625, partial [Alphaproteobacteria bacterium]|nr:hypothetical protein [Alphaproteobacteria bacterium]
MAGIAEDRGGAAVLVLVALAGLAMAFPLFAATLPAMPDYPAHLASFYLIAG